jgi:DNA-binding transcriptional ArsR family regulator
MNEAEIVAALAALAHEQRLRVFRLLVKRGPPGLPAGVIARTLGISPAALSFHVKELCRAGLLCAARRGRFVIYAVHIAGMRELLTRLTEDCCEGRPELCGGAVAAQLTIETQGGEQ